MKKMLLITLLLCPLGRLFCQNGPHEIVDKFFRLYAEETPDAALHYLFGTSKWADESNDSLESIKLKIDSIVVKQMGDYHGHNLLLKRWIGNRLTFFSYMVRYDREPIRFEFFFYKPKNTW